MSNELIIYPDREILEKWVEILETDTYLKLALPIVNERWYDRMLGTVERVKYSYSPNELHKKAAELFYKTNKAHHHIDGNKRSSILIVYLFYLVNSHFVHRDIDIRTMARKVARSKGRAQQEKWLTKLEYAFSGCVAPFTPEEIKTALEEAKKETL